MPLDEINAGQHRAWSELAERALEPNPYFEPDPVLAAGALLGGDQRIAVLLAERNGEAVFAMPVTRVAALHHVPVPALTTWLHPHAYLGAPLVDPADPVAAWKLAMDGLRRSRTAPRIALPQFPVDGPMRSALDRAVDKSAGPPTVLDPFHRAVLARRGTASYLNGRLSGSHRKRLRRQRRMLADQLGAEVRMVDRAAGGDITAAVDSFLRLEASGWKGRAGTAMACVPAHAQYFRQICANFHRRGRLRLVSLAAGDVDVAMACVVIGGDTAFHVKVAYDQLHHQCSPGLQLELELISDFHGDLGLQWIDSGSDGADTLSAKLYPDGRTLCTLLLPVYGARGRAASRSTPAVLTAGRAAKRVGSGLVHARTSRRGAVSP